MKGAVLRIAIILCRVYRRVDKCNPKNSQLRYQVTTLWSTYDADRMRNLEAILRP